MQLIVVLCAHKPDTYDIWLLRSAQVCITLVSEPLNELSIENDDFDVTYEPALLQALEDALTQRANKKCRAVPHGRTITASEIADVGHWPPSGLTLPETMPGTPPKSLACVQQGTTIGSAHPAPAGASTTPPPGEIPIPHLALKGNMSGRSQTSLNATGMTTATGLASAALAGGHVCRYGKTGGTHTCKEPNVAPALGGVTASGEPVELSIRSSNDKDDKASGKEVVLRQQPPPPASPSKRTARLFSQGAKTLMIRNLPCSVTHKRLLKELTATGFTGLFDFCYMPSLFGSGMGKGYAFINWISTDAVCDFVNSWHGSRRFGLQESDAAIDVSAAHVQGRENHLKKWNVRKMRQVRNPALRPLVFGGHDTDQV